MRQRKAEIWSKWRGLVAEQHQVGQSIAAFCREQSLPASQFFAWKRRVRDAEASQFVAVEVAPVVEMRRPEPAAPSGAIEVRLGGGRTLVVEPGFDARHLRALLSALEAEA